MHDFMGMKIRGELFSSVFVGMTQLTNSTDTGHKLSFNVSLSQHGRAVSAGTSAQLPRRAPQGTEAAMPLSGCRAAGAAPGPGSGHTREFKRLHLPQLPCSRVLEVAVWIL